MDRLLIERILAGDKDAFATLVQQHARWLYARIARQLRHPADADDLLQETLLHALTRLEQLRDPEQFAAWLTTIADNKVRTFYRRRAVQLRWQDEWAGQSENASAPSERPEQRTALHQALNALSFAHREILSYHYAKGYSYAQTADLLGLGIDTVRSRLQKARTRLKKEILNMAEQQEQPQVISLTESETRALRWATYFTHTDPQRNVLQGVYLDANGTLVATDGVRLLTWPLAALKNLNLPVLLGPWHRAEMPTAGGAVLYIENDQARLEPSSGEPISVPIMTGPYVHYEKVIPEDFTFCIHAEAGALLDAIAEMEDHLAPRHPTDSGDIWTYDPRVEIRIDAAAHKLSLLTTDRMGYSVAEDQLPPEHHPGGKTAWTFISTIDAKAESDAPPAFRTAVNGNFFREVVQALDLDGLDEIAISFIASDQIIRFAAVEHADEHILGITTDQRQRPLSVADFVKH